MSLIKDIILDNIGPLALVLLIIIAIGVGISATIRRPAIPEGEVAYAYENLHIVKKAGLCFAVFASFHGAGITQVPCGDLREEGDHESTMR